MSLVYDPPEEPTFDFVPPDAVVFSGGGPDGMAFIGCIRRLEEHPMGLRRVKTIVGSSIGAILALCLSLGMTSYDMEKFFISRYEDGSFRDLDVEGLVEFVQRMGVDDGASIVGALRDLVMSKIRVSDDITFMELAKATGKSLVICVTNLEDAKGELMSVNTTPDMGVLLAIRMSFGVPLVFTPVTWNGRTYVDGCMFEFCPTAHLFGPSASSILTFRIRYTAKESTSPMHFSEYLSLLVRATMTRSTPFPDSKQYKNNGGIVSKTVDVDSLMLSKDPPCRFDLASLSLEMDRDSILRYIKHGYESVLIPEFA